jgi:lipoprotein
MALKFNKITVAILFSTSLLAGCGGGGDGGDGDSGNHKEYIPDNHIVAPEVPKTNPPDNNKPKTDDKKDTQPDTNKPRNEPKPSLNRPTPKPNQQVNLINVEKGDLINSGYIDKSLVPFTSSYINVAEKNGVRVHKLKEIVGTKEFDISSGFVNERDFRNGDLRNRTQTFNPLTDKNTKYTLIKDDNRLSGKLIFNTRFNDTSHKWTIEELNKTFTKTPTVVSGAYTEQGSYNKSQIDIDTQQKLASRTRDDVAKIIVVDNKIDTSIPSLKGVKDRIYVFNHPSDKDYRSNAHNPDEIASHGERVTYTILGNTATEHPQWRGFLSQKGRVAFFSDRYNEELSELIDKPEFQQKVREGYNIINYSSAYILDDALIEKYKFRKRNAGETFQQYYDDVFANTRNFWVVEDALVKLNEMAKNNPDLLVFLAAGNYGKVTNGRQDNERANLFSLFLNSSKIDPNKTKYLRDHLIFVAYMNPETGRLNESSTVCGDSPGLCLTARGSVDDGYYISEGSSFASPYAASVAGLVKSIYPFMTGDQIRQVLFDNSKHPTVHYDNYRLYGKGILDPRTAASGPTKFNSDFVVDFNHNSNLLGQGQNFVFDNNIAGSHGLFIKGSPIKKNVLTLSGVNNYRGNTFVDSFGILNIEGAQTHSLTYVSTLGELYGSGYINSLVNQGKVFNYNYNLPQQLYMGKFDSRAEKGLTVYGDFYQSLSGELYTLLGRPLIVHGDAVLNGKLIVNGLDKAYVSQDGTIFEDALVAKGQISGTFNEVKSSTPILEVVKTTYNTGKANTVSVYAKYLGLKNNLDKYKGLVDPNYSSNVAQALDNVHYKVGEKLDELKAKGNLSNTEALALVNEKSGINALLNSLQSISASNGQYLNQYLTTLNGSDYRKANEENLSLSAISRFRHNGNMVGRKYNELSYGLQFRQNDGAVNNLLAKAVINKDTLVGVQLNYSGKLKAKDNKHPNEVTYKGVNIGITHKVFDFADITAYGSYSYFDNKMVKSTALAGKAYSFNEKYKQEELAGGLILSKSISTLSDIFDITPYVGYEFAQNKIAGLDKAEEFTISGKNFAYNLPKQHVNKHGWLAGIKVENASGLPFGLKFAVNYQIKQNKDKTPVVELSDELIRHSYNVAGKEYKVSHLVSAEIGKELIAGFTLSVHYDRQIYDSDKPDMQMVGLKLNYKF